MPKLNAVAAAANQVIAVVELSAMEREVALRLPMKNAQREIDKNLQADLERELQIAVERFLGRALEDPQEIVGRLTHGAVQDSLETAYCMDGTPILLVGPVSMVFKDDELHGRRVLEQLLPEVAI